MCDCIECMVMRPSACCVRRVVGGDRARGYCYESEPMSMMEYTGSVCVMASGGRFGSV